jgi:hypothetical protein
MPLPDDVRLMSADDHMIEPSHLWVDRVPARYRTRVPASWNRTTGKKRGCTRASSR